MINESLNATIGETTNRILTISYEQWTAVTTKPLFLLALGSIFFIAFIAFILAGLTNTGGKHFKKKLIEYPNYWFTFIIAFILLPGLILIGIVFPVWLK